MKSGHWTYATGCYYKKALTLLHLIATYKKPMVRWLRACLATRSKRKSLFRRYKLQKDQICSFCVLYLGKSDFCLQRVSKHSLSLKSVISLLHLSSLFQRLWNQVFLGNGVIMGVGAGLAMNIGFRIVTEKAVCFSSPNYN